MANPHWFSFCLNIHHKSNSNEANGMGSYFGKAKKRAAPFGAALEGRRIVYFFLMYFMQSRVTAARMMTPLRTNCQLVSI